MNLAVITCAAYSDAWNPFFQLLSKFWPDHPPVTLLTDDVDVLDVPANIRTSEAGPGASWCDVLRAYVDEVCQPFLLLQEDFLLTAPVRTDLVESALVALSAESVGGVRLYPCPGGVASIEGGDPRIGLAGPEYWLSCQATIFRPEFLRWALANIGTGSPSIFEIGGSKLRARSTWNMLAWKRHEKPWPMEYLCSAITRGKWTQDAKRLCDEHGIEVDWTRREMQCA